MDTWWRHWSREHWNVATVYTVLTSTPTPAAVLQNFRTTPAPANCSVCWLQQGGSDGLCSRLLLRLSELRSGRHGISSSRVTSTEYRVQSAELHTILCRVRELQHQCLAAWETLQGSCWCTAVLQQHLTWPAAVINTLQHSSTLSLILD